MTTVTLSTPPTAQAAGRLAGSSCAPADAGGDTPDFESVMAGQTAHADDPAPRSERTAAPRPAPGSDQAPPPAETTAKPTQSETTEDPNAAPVPTAAALPGSAAPQDPSAPLPAIAVAAAEPAEAKDEAPVESPAEPEDPTQMTPPVVAAPVPMPTAIPIPPAAMQAFGVPREPAATPTDSAEAGTIETGPMTPSPPTRMATEEPAALPAPDAVTPNQAADATRVDPAATQSFAKLEASATTEAGPAPAAPPPAPLVETQRQLAVHIGKAAQAGESTLTINLNPIALGPVAVRLSFHAGGVDLQLTVAQKSTYDSLVLDQSGLEQQLAQAGVNLTGGGVDLRFGAPNGGDQQGQTASALPGRPGAAPHGPLAEIVEHTMLPGQGLLNIIA